MKAIQIDGYGGPEVLVRRELAVPEPASGEVLVRVVWSGINFMDVHTRQGKYARSTTYPQVLPTTLGIEGAGVVERLGAGVVGLAAGDRVAYCLSWGSYAEYAVVPAWRVVRVPDGVELKLAAAVMFHGLTAHYLACDLGEPAAGVRWSDTSWLVHAASGGIGQMLVQLGTRLGVTVYATTSTEAKAAVALRRGAAVALGYEGFAGQVLALTGGRGVDVVFDPIGRPTFRESLRALRKKGLMVSFGSVGGSVNDVDPIELGEAGSLFLTRPRLADHLEDGETVRRRAGEVFAAILAGELVVEVAAEYEFEEVERAHAGLEGRGSVGKPVLRVGVE